MLALRRLFVSSAILFLLAFRANRLGRVRGNRSRRDRGRFRCGERIRRHPFFAGFLVILMSSDASGGGRGLRTGGRSRECWESAFVCILGLALIVGAEFPVHSDKFSSAGQGLRSCFARMLQDASSCASSRSTHLVQSPATDSVPIGIVVAWPTADGWLWTPDSPFFTLGHCSRVLALPKIRAPSVRSAILRYPSLQLQSRDWGWLRRSVCPALGPGDQDRAAGGGFSIPCSRGVPARQMRAHHSQRAAARAIIDFRVMGLFARQSWGALSLHWSRAVSRVRDLKDDAT